ncbi:hypothetical protein Ae201684_010135 [Aphanomyces euteiches]|uniref:Tc1-like transposase DDE domain-containing protein n=1 Tax=Aphanomyces euteiches TaxID=100861 RepID=A0A6G0WYW6_9STRA|nr:hypothetical protein Ae201684_010135 [Aphanomyces euteiches]
MSVIEVAVSHHAISNTVLHCLYGRYFLGMSKYQLSIVYGKCERTIANWIRPYEQTGDFHRKKTTVEGKFADVEKAWLVQFFNRCPLSFLDEAQSAFRKKFKKSISLSTIWRIVHDHGFTWKVDSICWSQRNMVFLDEVSFDNRGMLRKRGYALKGQKVVIRGEFTRKARLSLLCFAGADGLIDYYDTEGTFDADTFLRCCTSFARCGQVQMYLGSNSVRRKLSISWLTNFVRQWCCSPTVPG